MGGVKFSAKFQIWELNMFPLISGSLGLTPLSVRSSLRVPHGESYLQVNWAIQNSLHHCSLAMCIQTLRTGPL